MSDIKEEAKPIELNSWVRLTINNDQWVGEVVELNEDVALVRLLDNMHYRAKLEELELLTP